MAVEEDQCLIIGLPLTAISYFGHDKIRQYCNRPFKNLESMDKVMIERWNSRVKPGDHTIHAGDFCFKNSPGGKEGEGAQNKSTYYLDKLNGNKILLRGNHDNNNSTKAIVESMMIHHGGLDIFMTHIPPDNVFAVPDFTNLILCGHVHGAWKHKVIRYPSGKEPMMVLNIGVDCWNYYPINISDILSYLSKQPEWKECYGDNR